MRPPTPRVRDRRRQRVLAGATALANALRPMLGPSSGRVVLDRQSGCRLVRGVGATIASQARLADPDQDLGARILREAAVSTAQSVGDGTTTAALLAHAMFAECVRRISPGASAMEIRRGLARGHIEAIESLTSSSRPCETQGQRDHVGRNSAIDDGNLDDLLVEGVVPGGGVALLRAIPAIEALERESHGDLRTGLQILARALEIPARQIAFNSGFDPEVVVGHIRSCEGPIGFDAARGQYVDLREAGIVDPAVVVRTALANAVAVIEAVLLTESVVSGVE